MRAGNDMHCAKCAGIPEVFVPPVSSSNLAEPHSEFSYSHTEGQLGSVTTRLPPPHRRRSALSHAQALAVLQLDRRRLVPPAPSCARIDRVSGVLLRGPLVSLIRPYSSTSSSSPASSPALSTSSLLSENCDPGQLSSSPASASFISRWSAVCCLLRSSPFLGSLGGVSAPAPSYTWIDSSEVFFAFSEDFLQMISCLPQIPLGRTPTSA